MINLIRQKLEMRRVKRLFPQDKKDWWYSGCYYLNQSDLRETKQPWRSGEFMMPENIFIHNPFRQTGGSQPSTGGVLPCYRIGNWLGLYRVTHIEMPGPWSDRLCWDDGRNIDLVLIGVQPYNREDDRITCKLVADVRRWKEHAEIRHPEYPNRFYNHRYEYRVVYKESGAKRSHRQ